MGVPVAGIAFLFVDGNQYPLRGNFMVDPSSIDRTGIVGQDGVHGFQELPVVPFIEGDVTLDPALNIEDVEAIFDATVQADLINGHSYVLRNAWTAGRRNLNTREGLVRIRFEGMACQEISP
jgi:hypothetical protein